MTKKSISDEKMMKASPAYFAGEVWLVHLPGDVVTILAGEKHWHEAAPNITEAIRIGLFLPVMKIF